MIEQFVYDRISQDSALQTLLTAGGTLHLYPTVIPRGVNFERAVTFTLIITTDAFPIIESRTVQFNIFTKTHTDGANIAKALADLFNDDQRKSEDGVQVVYSIRQSESDLGFNYDDGIYQREATYSFKMK